LESEVFLYLDLKRTKTYKTISIMK